MNKTTKTAVICVCILLVVLIGASIAFFTISKSENGETTTETMSEEIASSEVQTESSTVENDISDDVFSGENYVNEETSDADADAKIATFGKMGESYTIHGKIYEQGEEKPEDEISDSLFDGDMEICVNEVNVYDFSQDLLDSRFDWTIFNDSLNNDPAILKVNFTLTNVDAQNRGGVAYEFYANIFKLGCYDDLIPDNYNNNDYYPFENYCASEFVLEPSGDGDAYYHFELNPGESKDFTITYMIDRQYLSVKDPFLAITLSSRQTQFGVLLSGLANS